MKIFDCAALGSKYSWDYTEKGISPEEEGIPPILETDNEINMGDLLIINGVAYCISTMSVRGQVRNIAYVRKLKEQKVFIDGAEPEEKDYTNEITCPFCGCEIESWEMEDEQEEHICENCGSTFSYQRNVTVEYCSQPIKKAEAIRLN